MLKIRSSDLIEARSWVLAGVCALLFGLEPLRGVTIADSVPENARELIGHYCLDCHSGDDPEGDVNLDVATIAWEDRKQQRLWERVHRVLTHEEMPPKKSEPLDDAQREALVTWVSQELSRHVPVGGTLPRRLNRVEYENTIRDLFGLESFVVSDSFPADDALDGFDNLGEGLILSPPLFAQFLELATKVADEILPPPSAPKIIAPKQYSIDAGGLGTDKDGGAGVAGDRYRLASSRNMASAAGWPGRFEATESGVYRFKVEVTPFQTEEMFYPERTEPFELAIYARKNGEQFYDFFDNLRELARFDVSQQSKAVQTFQQEIELYKGELFGLRWRNGPAYSDPPVREFSTSFLADRLLKNRRYYAAMLKVRGGPRGTTQSELYELTRSAMAREDLDLADPRLDTLPKVWGGGLGDAPHNWIKAYVLEELHRFGPALDILSVTVEGPIAFVEDEETRITRLRTERFLGHRAPGASDRDYVSEILARILPRIFRREITSRELNEYLELTMAQVGEAPGARIEHGLHLALRRALVSPQFLYRSIRPGVFDDFDLATRLSYFLTSAPPDSILTALAAEGRLSDPKIIRLQTIRLLSNPKSREFVRHFTGQWLGTRLLKDIMPDPRLLPFFDYDREMLIEETERLFSEILSENLSIEAFIDPGFSFRNRSLNKIYGGDLKGNEMQRVTLELGGRQGGILGLGSVMMATANGVDTQPILRGVWLLENVLGMPTPEPPGNVPAIAPDTSGATTMRELLDAHRADASCARCHDLIDPLGMVMENFDPVGRWRDHYPVYREPDDGPLKEEFYKNIGKGTYQGPRIESAGRMPDGVLLNDVTDLKQYIIERIDLFSRCLTEKLMVYATGRRLGFGDRRVVDQIVEDVKERGNGFQDLVIAVVESEAFRTK